MYFQGRSCLVDSISDSGDFKAVKQALDTLNFTGEEKEAIWEVIGAILHLGNVSFRASEDGLARIVDDTHVGYCSKVYSWNFECFLDILLSNQFVFDIPI